MGCVRAASSARHRPQAGETTRIRREEEERRPLGKGCWPSLPVFRSVGSCGQPTPTTTKGRLYMNICAVGLQSERNSITHTGQLTQHRRARRTGGQSRQTHKRLRLFSASSSLAVRRIRRRRRRRCHRRRRSEPNLCTAKANAKKRTKNTSEFLLSFVPFALPAQCEWSPKNVPSPNVLPSTTITKKNNYPHLFENILCLLHITQHYTLHINHPK